jgi:hypothetical protein
MNAKIINGDKPETVFIRAKNAESSASIVTGNPVALVMSETNDGLAVVLPGTATAVKAGVLAYGVACESIAAGDFGTLQCYGFCRNVGLVQATRSATNAAWASTAAGAVGDILTIDTTANAFARASVPANYVTGTAATDTLALALGMFLPMAVLAQTFASQTTIASTDGPVLTVSTGAVKVFLRML